jgi:Skp family chaperone for outer membrane proteins
MKSYFRFFTAFAIALMIASSAMAADQFKIVDKQMLMDEVRAHSGKSVVVFWAPW